MNKNLTGFIYLTLTVLFTVYGQLILKWRVNIKGAMPDLTADKLVYFLRMFTDFWVISAFLSAIIASLAWIATLSKFELSFAYPFMSVSFILVLFFSYFLLHETITWQKVTGLLLVIFGIIILTRS